MTEWNWLPEPVKPSFFDTHWVTTPKSPAPWGTDDRGVAFVVEEYGKQRVILIGDDTDLWSTAGCGCCSENQAWKILAWRRVVPKEAWEVPTREDPNQCYICESSGDDIDIGECRPCGMVTCGKCRQSYAFCPGCGE